MDLILKAKKTKVHSSDELLISEKVLPKSDESLADEKMENNEKSVMISKTSTKEAHAMACADSVLPFWVLSLPVTCVVAWVIISIPILIYYISNGIEQSIATNPCNAENSEAFQNYVTSWKEKQKNYANITYKIVIENDDMSQTIKEYYEREIQAATNMVLLEKNLDPEYQHYEKCFFDNKQSKINHIFYFCIASYIIFNICFSACFLYINYYSTQLTSKPYHDKILAHYSCKVREGIHMRCLVVPSMILFQHIIFYRVLLETVPTDFIL